MCLTHHAVCQTIVIFVTADTSSAQLDIRLEAFDLLDGAKVVEISHRTFDDIDEE